MKTKFFKCKICGNEAVMIHHSGVTPVCCDNKMMELIPGFDESASKEKHIPDVKITDNKVEVVVGSVIHPMEEKHYIEWIYLETKKGGLFKKLKPKEEPKATFLLAEDDELQVVYEYCNIHGLWAKKV